jgi:hypothetical protein
MSTKELEAAYKVVQLTKGGGTIAVTRGLWVASDGTISFIDFDGNTVSDFDALAGYIPIRITNLLAGGTAGNVYGLY